jgi:NTE family protein
MTSSQAPAASDDAARSLAQTGSDPLQPAGVKARLSQMPLFEGIDRDALAAIEAELEWISLPGGAPLFREGDPADAFYVVASGSLGVMLGAESGEDRLVALVHAGETVGEMAVVSGAPRSASVIALRDAELLRLARPALETLIDRHPRAMLHITRLLACRLQSTTRRAAPARAPRTLALLPLDSDVLAAALARGLAHALSQAGQRVHLLDRSAEAHTSDWFHRVEAAHDLLIYQAEAKDCAWTRLCLRQADRILAAAWAGSPPDVLPAEPTRGRAPQPLDLLLLQRDDASRPAPAGPWLERMPADFHHHIRPGSGEDIARLARFVSGRAVGLVLSGGGARGFAHIGVIRALRRAGIPLDIVAGTSMGSIIAAGAAVGWDDDALRDHMHRAFVTSNPVDDYTVPVVALIRGRKVSRRLREHFGEIAIEDLWRTYFCVSANLTSGHAKVHRRGPLWRALRASVAIPGVLTPVVEAGEVLVDGGVINNFPVDVMRGLGRGPVIGVSLASDPSLVSRATDLEDKSLWWLLGRGRREAPGIASVLMRSGTVGSDTLVMRMREQTDLLLTPPMKGIDTLDWRAFDRAIERGYRYTMETLGRLGADGLKTIAA